MGLAAGGFHERHLSCLLHARLGNRREFLEDILARPHRYGWLLGDPLAQYSRFYALCQVAKRPGLGSDHRPAGHHGAVFLHRHCRYQRYAPHLRRGDLGPGGPACPFRFSHHGGHLHDRSDHRHAFHQYRSQRSSPGQQHRQHHAWQDQLSHGRLHHRHYRHSHLPLETVSRSARLYLRVAHRIFRIARRAGRCYDLRLLRGA